MGWGNDDCPPARFLAGAKNRMLDLEYDPQLRQCLRALRRNEKEFAELLKACDLLQQPCRGACKQVGDTGDIGDTGRQVPHHRDS